MTLCGCVDDHSLLNQVHEYFPGATLYKFDPHVLWIQTNVDGISGKFAERTFDVFLQEMETTAQQKSFGFVHLSDALAHDGYVFLVLGFRRGIVVWDRRANLRWTLTWPQAPAWFTEHLGYYPKQGQIEIVGPPSAGRSNAASPSASAVLLHAQSTLPAGAEIVVTLNQSVSSKDAQSGQTIAGSVAEDVAGVIPKGSRVMLSVASAQSSGISVVALPKLWLKMDWVEVNGKTYEVSTRWSGQTGRAGDIIFLPETKLRFALKSALTIQ